MNILIYTGIAFLSLVSGLIIGVIIRRNTLVIKKETYTDEYVKRLELNYRSAVRALDDLELRHRETKEQIFLDNLEIDALKESVYMEKRCVNILKMYQPGTKHQINIDGKDFDVYLHGWLCSENGLIVYVKSNLTEKPVEITLFKAIARKYLEKKRKAEQKSGKSKVVQLFKT